MSDKPSGASGHSPRSKKRRQPRASRTTAEGDRRDAAWNQAIAAIAGGFAHDANNCLTGIFSMSDLCLAQVDPQGPLHEPLSLMRDSAHQASLLLQRLTRLIYDPSGTATYHDLNDITSEMADIMRRVLARHVDLQLQLCEVALPVLVDAVELRKALIYLVLDFAAGFPGAGRIVVSTRLSVEPIAHAGFWGCVPATPVVSVGISRDEAGWTADETERLASIMEGVGRSGADAARLRLVRDFAQKHGGGLCLREESPGRQLELCLPRADLDKAL